MFINIFNLHFLQISGDLASSLFDTFPPGRLLNQSVLSLNGSAEPMTKSKDSSAVIIVTRYVL